MDPTPWWPLPAEELLRDRLLAAWTNPARGYHDARHLAEVCARIDEITRAADPGFDRVTVLLAAWFHDAVYDAAPGAEERSAAWAEEALTAAGLPEEQVVEVARLVRLTETHRPADDDANGGVLCDADLAILAAPRDRYDEYVTAVRAEYAHVPDAAFRAGRAAVLRGLLAGPFLFHTPYAREHWEVPARANVEREIGELES